MTHQRKTCTSYKNSYRRPGTHLRVFQTWSSSRACVSTTPTGKVGRPKQHVELQRSGYFHSKIQTRVCKHPVFKCSNILQTGALVKRKKGGGVGTHFKNETDNHRMLVNMVLACNPLSLFFAVNKCIQNKMSVWIQTSTLGLHQEEVTAVAHHRPHACAVDEHKLHRELSIRAADDQLLFCNPPVCAVGDHVLLESKKAQVKEPLEPAQQELVVKACQEAGFSETVDVVQLFRTRLVCDAHGRRAAPYCK